MKKLERKSSRTRFGMDLAVATAAAQDKKAEDVTLLDLRAISSFTNYFLIATGRSQRQTQAIANFVEEKLKEHRKRRAMSIEGYQKGDWILMDYGDFVVHVFTPPTRLYYDLERIWGDARKMPL